MRTITMIILAAMLFAVGASAQCEISVHIDVNRVEVASDAVYTLMGVFANPDTANDGEPAYLSSYIEVYGAIYYYPDMGPDPQPRLAREPAELDVISFPVPDAFLRGIADPVEVFWHCGMFRDADADWESFIIGRGSTFTLFPRVR